MHSKPLLRHTFSDSVHFSFTTKSTNRFSLIHSKTNLKPVSPNKRPQDNMPTSTTLVTILVLHVRTLAPSLHIYIQFKIFILHPCTLCTTGSCPETSNRWSTPNSSFSLHPSRIPLLRFDLLVAYTRTAMTQLVPLLRMHGIYLFSLRFYLATPLPLLFSKKTFFSCGPVHRNHQTGLFYNDRSSRNA